MAEIWAEIQPHIWEIVGSIGMIAAIILKGPNKTEEQKAQHKFDKAHKASVKAEKKLHTAYKKEAAAEKELKK